jgi:hypothetical protein
MNHPATPATSPMSTAENPRIVMRRKFISTKMMAPPTAMPASTPRSM